MAYKFCMGFIVSLAVALGLASGQARSEPFRTHRGVALGVASDRARGEAFRTRQDGEAFRTHQDNVNITSTLDVPWDWAHRYPPSFFAGPPALFFPPVTVQVGRPVSRDTNFTYTFDVPWDWAHRYPPSFFTSPPEPPAPVFARTSGCHAQDETVGLGDGKQQTITMLRC